MRSLCFVCLIASSVHAKDVLMKTTWDGQSSTGSGGPFTAYLLDGADNPILSSAWISFCIEGNEYVSDNGKYYTEIATSAKAGGFMGANNGLDELSQGAAWLYRQVHDAAVKGKGNDLTALTWLDPINGLQTFDATDVAGDLSEIQRVIWSMEGEAAAGGAISSERFDAIKQMVIDHFGGGADYLLDGKDTNLFGVRVMRLWDNADYTGKRQDQLIIIPMPAPVAMAAAGLFGVGLIRRRR